MALSSLAQLPPDTAADPSQASQAEVSLDTLAPGAGALIVGMRDESSATSRRLLDLGFIPGSGVKVLRRAPLGDPVEYELRGYRICLRRSEAARVRVCPA